MSALRDLGAGMARPALAGAPTPHALAAAPRGSGAARGGSTIGIAAVPEVSVRFLSGALAGQRRPVGPGVVIGRDPGIAQIVVPDSQVSGGHAWLGVHEGAIVFVDRGSTHGSIINGAPVQRQAEIAVKPGDVVTLGPATGVAFVVEAG